jgi:hypothetical protein
MTQLQHWAIDPFDIVWKNLFDANSNFNTIQHKINYPVDIYETQNGLRFELAVVGIDKEEINISVEELNEEKFISEFTKATIKNWKGFKYKYLEDFVLVNLSAVDPEAQLPYTQDNAKLLVTNSSEFDTWVNDTVFDLENFRSGAEGGNVGATGKVAQES